MKLRFTLLLGSITCKTDYLLYCGGDDDEEEEEEGGGGGGGVL